MDDEQGPRHVKQHVLGHWVSFFYTILFFLTKVLFVYSYIPLLLMMHDEQLTMHKAQYMSSTWWGGQQQQQKVSEKAQNSLRHV